MIDEYFKNGGNKPIYCMGEYHWQMKQILENEGLRLDIYSGKSVQYSKSYYNINTNDIFIKKIIINYYNNLIKKNL